MIRLHESARVPGPLSFPPPFLRKPYDPWSEKKPPPAVGRYIRGGRFYFAPAITAR